MGSLEIGISGLHTAQNALDIIGNNIANASTDGYHRQEADIRPMDDLYTSGALVGQGSYIKKIKRQINELLNTQIRKKESDISQLDRELDSLMTLESAFGELSTAAMSTALDDFYNAFHHLSEEPSQVAYQSEVESAAEVLCNQMNKIGDVVTDLEDKTYEEAKEVVDEINLMGSQIAELNNKIKIETVRGGKPSNMLDQRDELISQLSELSGVTTYDREFGVKDVMIGNIPLVVSTSSSEVEAGLVVNGDEYDLGISLKDMSMYSTEFHGGRLGGLANLRNSILRGIRSNLNSLAENIITETNKIHVQGIGTFGSFERLSGIVVNSQNLDEIEPPVSNGTINIRITDTNGNVARGSVAVVTTDTLSDVATDISNMNVTFGAGPAIQPLNASVVGGKLEIWVDPAYSGYKFDFLPNPLPRPNLSGWAGGPGGEAEPDIVISGNYTGTSNKSYTCEVVTTPPGGTGSIGSGDIALEVREGAALITTINIGTGYVPGTTVQLSEGIDITLGANGSSAGFVNDGETFTIDMMTDSDTSSLLASAGINNFFTGSAATNMAVSEQINETLGRIAVTRTSSLTDNISAKLLAALGDQEQSALGSISQKDYYRRISMDIGEQISMKTMEQENTYGVWKSLNQQRDDVSGVDINDQATQMLVYERMFQGMAKFLNTVDNTLSTLMGILR